MSELCHELVCPDGPEGLSREEMGTAPKPATAVMGTGQELGCVSCRELIDAVEASPWPPVMAQNMALRSMILGL